MSFPGEVKEAALARAKHRCERCWSSRDLEFHPRVPVSKGGDYSLNNCVVLCRGCRRLAPEDPFLLEHLFLRFASAKEMIQYYGAESEQEALNKWRIETSQKPKAHGALVKEKMEEKAKKGGYLGFAHPYGYDYRDNKLIPNPAEAPVVKKIYQLYVKGWSLGRIAAHLRESNIPTKRRGQWDKRKISNILKNPLYCGFVDWNGIVNQGQHEAIIDKKTFLRVQKILEARSGKPYSLEIS